MGDIIGKLFDTIFEVAAVVLFVAAFPAWWLIGAEAAIILILSAIYMTISLRME